MNTSPVNLVTSEIPGRFDVYRGRTFLASVTFDGPRETMRTHSGTLYADERKEVYRLHDEEKRLTAPR